MANEKEYICESCEESFLATRKRKYCCRECRAEERTWSDRLHDGMRLLSDNFGEEDGDEFIPFQK